MVPLHSNIRSMDFQSTPQDLKVIDISPDLLRAYGSNLLKVFILFGAVIGAYYLSTSFVGANPFLDMLDQLGIDFSLVLKVLAGLAGLTLFIVILQATSLSTNRLLFKQGKLTYSYGGFFKVTKTVSYFDIVKVNYDRYSIFKTGDLEVELSGTSERKVKLPFVADVEDKCQKVNELVNFKKSDQVNTVAVSDEDVSIEDEPSP